MRRTQQTRILITTLTLATLLVVIMSRERIATHFNTPFLGATPVTLASPTPPALLARPGASDPVLPTLPPSLPQLPTVTLPPVTLSAEATRLLLERADADPLLTRQKSSVLEEYLRLRAAAGLPPVRLDADAARIAANDIAPRVQHYNVTGPSAPLPNLYLINGVEWRLQSAIFPDSFLERPTYLAQRLFAHDKATYNDPKISQLALSAFSTSSGAYVLLWLYR